MPVLPVERLGKRKYDPIARAEQKRQKQEYRASHPGRFPSQQTSSGANAAPLGRSSAAAVVERKPKPKSKKAKGKAAAAAKQETGPAPRKGPARPITQAAAPIKDDDDSFDELDDFGDEDMKDDIAEDESADELDVDSDSSSSLEDAEEEDDADEEELQVKSGASMQPKESAREAHQKQKVQQQERKAAKPHADLLSTIKSLWGQLNRKKLVQRERERLVNELYAAVKGNVCDVIFKHDASRCVQACFKFGSNEQRLEILAELKGRIVELSESTYGKFLVVKMLHYGNRVARGLILDELRGKIRKLIRHREAAYVVEDAFREYTNPVQQERMVQELYGAEFAVFGNDTKPLPLVELLAAHPEKRDVVMHSLFKALKSSIEKGSIGFTILHRALLYFTRAANPAERTELIDLVKDQLPEIVHTRDGAEVACLVIAYASAKERKAIMKAFREHIVQALFDEFGWMPVLAMFTCVDDTVLLTKAFVPEIAKQPVPLLESKNARKVFLHTLAGPRPQYLGANELELVQKVESAKQGTSKKDDAIRRREIADQLVPVLLPAVQESLDGMLGDPSAAPLLLELILQGGEAARTALVPTVVAYYAKPPADCLAEHSPRFLRNLVQGGYFNSKAGKVDRSAVGDDYDFGTPLIKAMLPHATAWATGVASFVVVSLFETEGLDPAAVAELKQALRQDKAKIAAAVQAGNKGSKIIVSTL